MTAICSTHLGVFTMHDLNHFYCYWIPTFKQRGNAGTVGRLVVARAGSRPADRLSRSQIFPTRISLCIGKSSRAPMQTTLGQDEK